MKPSTPFQVSSVAFSDISLFPNPHHQPLLNLIFFHCSDNHSDKPYVSNCNNRLPVGALSFWEIERRFVYLGAIRDVSKHRLPKGPSVQLGRPLAGRHSFYTLNPNNCSFSQGLFSISLRDWALLTSINLGIINKCSPWHY
jgi:hypothetical protein